MVVVICCDDSFNNTKYKSLVSMIIDTNMQRVIVAKNESNEMIYEYSAPADDEYPVFHQNGGVS